MKLLMYRHGPYKQLLTNSTVIANSRIFCLDQWRSSSSSSSDEYQFIEKSKLPMLHFQPSLPRLPIPKLENTCERYLKAQRPLLDNDSYERTEKIVKKFHENGEGKELQAELEANDKRNKQTSYISAPWFDMYLESRDPIAINYNPYLGIVDDPKPEYNDQLIRASNVLISSLRFLRSLRSNLLQPEIYHLNPSKSDNESFRKIMRLIPSKFSWYGAYLYKAFPLDMSQYQGLFNATRIPKNGRDELLRDQSAKHMVVIRNGHFYVFDVLDKNGNIREPSYVHGCLKQILSETRQKPEHPVAVLTSENRDVWANLREQLVEAGNSDVLKLIDTAIFALDLDDESTNEDPIRMSKMMLHGDGANRWFDKCLQLIVSKDGKVAINFEHSWGDGVAILRYMNELFNDSTKKHFVHPNSIPSVVDANDIRHLEFKLNPQLKDGIETALRKFEAAASKIKFNVMQYQKYGKNFFKSQKLSPDALLQLSFQMAFHRQTGKTVPTYESCSTAAFKHGRTETIRPATTATKKCSEAFSKRERPPLNELRAMIEDCSKIHGKLVKEAALGQGFDRHLFALRTLAEAKNEQKIPEMFRDPSYVSINKNILSTSTLSSDSILIAGFGPVVPDGLGIGYFISDNGIAAMITSYPPLRDASGFVECLRSSLDDIHEVLSKTTKVETK